LSKFDILLVPGGTPEPVDAQVVAIGGPFLNAIEAFARLESDAKTVGGEPGRVLL